ncbi:hypothetical protein AGDE_16363 [Angomonas deanei]|uniref:Uncharacterized protein n=1 Tax=Angomonas deanei TaxID=59799 RepID=A0A7G2C1Z1_9TRYP|nr:hypothetical protein AGDE_16363 [Angomonas deanei]CAD2213669.1 hypothetical protein, conserved [Angomonas deanei]|eukprot:EPY17220.1 hypothetical protein AGDE_16363 [Angomonas deanei]
MKALHKDYSVYYNSSLSSPTRTFLYVLSRTVLEEHIQLYTLYRDQQSGLQQRTATETPTAPFFFTLDLTLLHYVTGSRHTVDGYVLVFSQRRTPQEEPVAAVEEWFGGGTVIPVRYGSGYYYPNPKNR